MANLRYCRNHSLGPVNRAFTLAEVLITLTIIGVVAALTIPAILQNVNDAQNKTALKKVVSVINNAGLRVAADNGGTLKGVFNYFYTNANGNIFKSYFSYVKACNADQFEGSCWHLRNTWYDSDGHSSPVYQNNFNGFYHSYFGFVLADGTLIIVSADTDLQCQNAYNAWFDLGANNGSCLAMIVDTNGFKGPNIWGKDIHSLFLGEHGEVKFPIVFDTGVSNASTKNTGLYLQQ